MSSARTFGARFSVVTEQRLVVAGSQLASYYQDVTGIARSRFSCLELVAVAPKGRGRRESRRQLPTVVVEQNWAQMSDLYFCTPAEKRRMSKTGGSRRRLRSHLSKRSPRLRFSPVVPRL